MSAMPAAGLARHPGARALALRISGPMTALAAVVARSAALSLLDLSTGAVPALATGLATEEEAASRGLW
eukprot:5821420-Alexandrium_andersonii.AAC.1